jgi:hypothetical protein
MIAIMSASHGVASRRHRSLPCFSVSFISTYLRATVRSAIQPRCDSRAVIRSDRHHFFFTGFLATGFFSGASPISSKPT